MSFASPVPLSVEESDLRAYFTPLPSAAATQWSVADHKVAAQRLAFVCDPAQPLCPPTPRRECRAKNSTPLAVRHRNTDTHTIVWHAYGT